ncbi:hypothetical protein EPI10_001142 [Gossypium australe]|uniref:Uncharacterized protein n=1 Tax=Gossypium australe TaxID=47621 RepID=A0A5B6VA34_9ROSI|nr:hypothetical protein EPI10_001142 [Gossypium australe]
MGWLHGRVVGHVTLIKELHGVRHRLEPGHVIPFRMSTRLVTLNSELLLMTTLRESSFRLRIQSEYLMNYHARQLNV